MNEQIKQLAERAGSTHKQNLGVYQFFENELQQFAELIADECAKVCEAIYNDPNGNNGEDAYYTRPYLECAEAIRERMK